VREYTLCFSCLALSATHTETRKFTFSTLLIVPPLYR
jgi:hypothetical protein